VNPLPASKVGGKVLVRRRDFDTWLHSHRVVTGEQVNEVVDDLLAELK
jgi:hypothetical protein